MSLEQLRSQLDESMAALNYATNHYGQGNESINPKTFISLLSSLTERSKAVISHLTEEADKASESIFKSTKSDYDIGNSANIVNWIDMTKTRGFKPDSASKSNSDICELLVSLTDEMLACDTALKAANALFSDYITHPEDLAKFSGSVVPKLDRVKNAISEFQTHFDGAMGMDRNLFGELYKSYRDFGIVSDRLVTLTEKFNAKSVKELKSGLDKLDDTLEILITTIRDNDISKDVAQRIGKTVYNLADWTALFSLYITKLISLEKAHRDNAQVIIIRTKD